MPTRSKFEKLMGPLRCAPDVTLTTRELKEGDEDDRRVGSKSWKRRKWERWLVPNWSSKPSSVRPSGGLRIPSSFSTWRSISEW